VSFAIVSGHTFHALTMSLVIACHKLVRDYLLSKLQGAYIAHSFLYPIPHHSHQSLIMDENNSGSETASTIPDSDRDNIPEPRSATPSDKKSHIAEHQSPFPKTR
jgi:hypothetical protein